MATESTADYDGTLWLEVPMSFPAPGYDSAEDWARYAARKLVPVGSTEQVYLIALRIAQAGYEVAERRFWYIARGVMSGGVVTVSEPDRRIATTDVFIQLSLEASDTPERPAIVRESVTELGELLVSSTLFLADETGVTPKTVHRFLRLGTDTAVMASCTGGVDELVPHIQTLLVQFGRLEPVAIGRSEQTEAWQGVAVRAGIDPVPAASPAAAVPLVFRRTDAQLAAGVLQASARDEASAELTQIALRDAVGRRQLGAGLIMGAVTPPSNRPATLTAVVSIVLFVTGFALVGVASDSNETVGLIGAVVIAVAAVFLGIRLVAARRRRASALGSKEIARHWDAQVVAYAAEQATLDEILRADLTSVLGSPAAQQIDREVAVATLRDLVVSGKVPAERADDILATILGRTRSLHA